MIRYVPQLEGNQKTRYTTQANKSKKKEKREVKQNEPGIVMSGEETEGQQNDHQKRDGNDELRENCKKMPATFEAVQTHLKVKKSPRHNGSDYHEKVRLKTRCEIDRVSRAGVSQRRGKAQGPEHPEQIGGQYPISKGSDFHFVEEGDSAFFVGVSNLHRWSLPVFASGSACGRSRHRATRYAAIDNPENRMSHREMQVFDDLHVIGRDDYADVAQGFHFPALATRDADPLRSSLSRHLQGVQNIFGVAAPTYGHRHISWLHKIPQLFRKDVFIARVVCPSCQSWQIVGKREGA